MGMEMMLAQLLGITPEEMRETVRNAIELLGSLEGRFKAIEEKQDEILSRLPPKVIVTEAGIHIFPDVVEKNDVKIGSDT